MHEWIYRIAHRARSYYIYHTVHLYIVDDEWMNDNPITNILGRDYGKINSNL